MGSTDRQLAMGSPLCEAVGYEVDDEVIDDVNDCRIRLEVAQLSLEEGCPFRVLKQLEHLLSLDDWPISVPDMIGSVMKFCGEILDELAVVVSLAIDLVVHWQPYYP